MTMQGMTIFLVLAMAGYFVVTNHVQLAPLNNLSSERPQYMSTAVGTVPALLVVLALVENRGLLLAASWLWIWFLLQVRQWWIPYFFGSTKLHRDFRWYTAGGYNRTLRVLSLKGDRPVPDVQHIVLQLLTILSAVAVTAHLIHSNSQAWWQMR